MAQHHPADDGRILVSSVAGESEAMKTAWISNALTVVRSTALLAAMGMELREPNDTFRDR